MTNREFFLQRRSTEAVLFERIFHAVPQEKVDWRPEPKARSARALLGHLIGHEQDLLELCQSGEIHHRNQVPFDDVHHAIRLFREAYEGAQASLGAMADEPWDENLTRFLVNGSVVYEAARRDLGWMLLFDSIHHRGQLSTYLRPMGSRVPWLYGPSADDTGVSSS